MITAEMTFVEELPPPGTTGPVLNCNNKIKVWNFRASGLRYNPHKWYRLDGERPKRVSQFKDLLTARLVKYGTVEVVSRQGEVFARFTPYPD